MDFQNGSPVLDFHPGESIPGWAVLKINEIFYSIQGESTSMGVPTVFVRTTGCNLRCTYCDTKYSYYEGEDFPLENVVEKVLAYESRALCVTGGEPLLQKEVLPLMSTFCDRGYNVSLETSGSKSCEHVDPRVRIILDVKTPDSGAANSFLVDNFKWLRANTEFKFVICSENDFHWAENFCRQHDLMGKFTVLYSPSHESFSAQWLAQNILSQKSRARLQLQLHKYIWSSHTRGV